MNKYFFISILLLFLLGSCNQEKKELLIRNKFILSDCNQLIIEAVVNDRISAPAASRRYYYANVAAYEALVNFYPNYTSLNGQLNELTAAPKPDTSKGYCLDLVAAAAHTTVSKQMVFYPAYKDSLELFRENLKQKYSNLTSSMIQRSFDYGDSVGMHIVRWSKKDKYVKFHGAPAYVPKKEIGKWQPTGPDFMEAIEPHWGELRTAVIKDPSKLELDNPPIFDKNPSSMFYKSTKEVYEVSKSIDSSKKVIAWYWDDNPNATTHLGHATIHTLKTSPAGHWLNIFATVAREKNYELIASAEGMARVSAGIYDAFICCWQKKYETEYLRPETAIKILFDSSWSSMIQTPPFPEYPSGHSVVSTTASIVLTHLFGDYKFIDSTEMPYNLGARTFNSFNEAATEACISRLYGGIHFREGIEGGKALGRKVGEAHTKLKTH